MIEADTFMWEDASPFIRQSLDVLYPRNCSCWLRRVTWGRKTSRVPRSVYIDHRENLKS